MVRKFKLTTFLNAIGNGLGRRASSRHRRSLRPMIEILEDRVVPATVFWNTDASGFSDVPSNWLDDQAVSRLPGVDDDVVINRPEGDFTITVRSGAQSITSLASDEALVISGGSLAVAEDSSIDNTFTLSGGTLTGAGDMTVTGAFTWSSGTMNDAGTTVIPLGTTLTLSGTASKTLARTLENAGTIDYTGSGLTFSSTGGVGLINNLAGAVFNATGDLSVGSGSGNSFNNAGTFNRTGAGSSVVSIAFHSTGAVNVLEGTLALRGGGTHDAAADFLTSSGTTLELGGDHTFPAEADIHDHGSLLISSGTTSYAGQINTPGSLTIAGGTLTIAGTVTVNSLNLLSPSTGFRNHGRPHTR